MDIDKPWLSSLPWEQVQGLNQMLCKQQSTTYQANPNYEAARQLWQKAAAQPMSLQAVLDVCRKCYELAPFTFNNGNTFAAIGKKLLEEWLSNLPALEAQIIGNTVGHYIAGVVNKRELVKVLRHFETSWKTYAAARQSMPNLAALQVAAKQQAQAVANAGLEGAMLTPPQ